MNLIRLRILLLFIFIITTTHFFAPSESRMQKSKKTGLLKYLDVIGEKVSNSEPYVSSPFTLPPYDSLPVPPQTEIPPPGPPPYCSYPITPNAPQFLSPPPPLYYYQSPPSGPIYTYPGSPSPPSGPIYTSPGSTGPPSGPIYTYPGSPSPPYYYYDGPPSPGGGVYEPPVIYPSVPPPPANRNTGGSRALWCVAKPSVPDPIIEEAMNYACGTVADCESILASGACYEPNTPWAHASYAFNSYWQRTKAAGGTCEFGGTAMLVTVDPSYDGCHFIYA